MTIERFELIVTGPLMGKVYYSIPEDPTMGTYVVLFKVSEDQTSVKVATPLIAKQPLSQVEIEAVVRLLLRRLVYVDAQSLDTVDTVEDHCPRCCRTYGIKTS